MSDTQTAPDTGRNNATAENVAATSDTDFTKSWRYKAGIFMFFGGQIALVVGLVLPVLGLASAGLTGLLVVGGELTTISSIVFLGKAGFLAIKKKLFGALKTGFEMPIGRTRHYLGIAILFVNMFTTYTTAIYAWAAFSASTPDAPTAPVVWGLDLEGQESLVMWLFIAGQACFLVAIYVLGGDWWERVRNLVIWKSHDERIGSSRSEPSTV